MKKTLNTLFSICMIIFLVTCSAPAVDDQNADNRDTGDSVNRLSLDTGIVKSAYSEALIEYTITNPAQSSFGVNVKITNKSDTSIEGWTLTWTFDGNQKITDFWNAEVEQAGNKVSVQPVSWNATIAPGKSVSFGFNASFSGENSIPSDLTLKAKGGSASSVAITAPVDGSVFETGEVIAITAEAEQTGSAVTSVSFYAGDSLIATDKEAPYTASWTVEKAGAVSLKARALLADKTTVESSSVSITVKAKVVNGDDWLSVVGNTIVDSDGNAVWLTGTNWFGFNTGSNCFDGLWSCNLEKALTGMAKRGINILRVPISTEIIYQWSQGEYPMPSSLNDYVNPDLDGKNSLEIFDITLEVCRELGMKIMVDVHSPDTNAMGHLAPLWTKGDITLDKFYDAWVWIAERYKDNDTVIAFDLENEPHGKPWQTGDYAKWDSSTDDNNWKYIAEECAARILAVNPNVLILVEGIEGYPKPGKDYSSKSEGDYFNTWWGGNLRGVKDHPVNLGSFQNKLVYSPHDYGPLVYEQTWFKKDFTQQTLYEDCWRDNWAYIMEDNIAPLLLGEWGGLLDGGKNEKWMGHLRDYIVENYIHHTFWCYNANSGDTGGLVGHDFITWDEDKYALVKPSLWQKDDKFVGLDHQIPLGGAGSGITVTQYYLDGGKPPVPPKK